jgi:preprotein translocase subunit SecG
MQTVLLVIHLIIALALVGTILLQRSEGGALGIGGGGGNSGSIFSARGVGNALTRTTAILAVCFFVTSLALTVLATRGGVGGSAFDGAVPATTNDGAAPAAKPDDAPVLPQLGQEPAAPAKPQVPTNN